MSITLLPVRLKSKFNFGDNHYDLIDWLVMILKQNYSINREILSFEVNYQLSLYYLDSHISICLPSVKYPGNKDEIQNINLACPGGKHHQHKYSGVQHSFVNPAWNMLSLQFACVIYHQSTRYYSENQLGQNLGL